MQTFTNRRGFELILHFRSLLESSPGLVSAVPRASGIARLAVRCEIRYRVRIVKCKLLQIGKVSELILHFRGLLESSPGSVSPVPRASRIARCWPSESGRRAKARSRVCPSG